MNAFCKTMIMFISSNEGLYITWVLLYTFYLYHKTGKYSYFWFILLPIVPIIHFCTTKKPKKIWIFFVLLMLLSLYFSYSIQPHGINGKIIEATIHYKNVNHVFHRKNQLKSIIDIKWEVYKREFLSNIGIQRKSRGYFGDLEFLLEGGARYYFSNYPLDDILKILDKEKIK